MTTIYDFSAIDIEGKEVNLAQFKGQVVLIVNTASKCGFTKQYAGLEDLYRRYKNEGFVVLGFPCNQFLSQEPGLEEDIKNFCSINYDVTFPMFSKIEVNGKSTHPLYKYLKSECRGMLGTGAIKWNFTKFLINQSGEVVRRYAPSVEPITLTADIAVLLKGIKK